MVLGPTPDETMTKIETAIEYVSEVAANYGQSLAAHTVSEIRKIAKEHGITIGSANQKKKNMVVRVSNEITANAAYLEDKAEANEAEANEAEAVYGLAGDCETVYTGEMRHYSVIREQDGLMVGEETVTTQVTEDGGEHVYIDGDFAPIEDLAIDGELLLVSSVDHCEEIPDEEDDFWLEW
jgi:hypothetical protein